MPDSHHVGGVARSKHAHAATQTHTRTQTQARLSHRLAISRCSFGNAHVHRRIYRARHQEPDKLGSIDRFPWLASDCCPAGEGRAQLDFLARFLQGCQAGSKGSSCKGVVSRLLRPPPPLPSFTACCWPDQTDRQTSRQTSRQTDTISHIHALSQSHTDTQPGQARPGQVRPD